MSAAGWVYIFIVAGFIALTIGFCVVVAARSWNDWDDE